jgi:Protein of unknown function (DUF2934)
MAAKLQPKSGLRQPTREEIAARAYQIYLERGCQHGHDADDWLQAEYELMQVPVRVLADLEASKGTRKAKTGKSLVDVVKMVVY